MLLGQSPTSLCLDNFVLAVTLVRHKNFGNIGVRMLIYLLEPVRDVIKSCLIGAIVHKDNTHGTLVVSLSNCTESFLTGCVPDLQFDPFIVNVDFLDLEVNT
jgi:hypothetical protein